MGDPRRAAPPNAWEATSTVAAHRRGEPDGFTEDEWVFMRAATWADWVRGRKEFDHPTWHYINYPIVPPGSAVKAADHEPPAKQENVVNQLSVCLDKIRAGTDVEKAVYMTWLIHFVGDIHQPLHCTNVYGEQFPNGDKGGNDAFIRIRSSPVKLHAMWKRLLGTGSSAGSIGASVAMMNATYLPQPVTVPTPGELQGSPISASPWLSSNNASVAMMDATYLPQPVTVPMPGELGPWLNMTGPYTGGNAEVTPMRDGWGPPPIRAEWEASLGVVAPLEPAMRPSAEAALIADAWSAIQSQADATAGANWTPLAPLPPAATYLPQPVTWQMPGEMQLSPIMAGPAIQGQIDSRVTTADLRIGGQPQMTPEQVMALLGPAHIHIEAVATPGNAAAATNPDGTPITSTTATVVGQATPPPARAQSGSFDLLRDIPAIPGAGGDPIGQVNRQMDRLDRTGGTLTAGDAPVYGSDGNRTASQALGEAAEQVKELGHHVAGSLSMLPGVGVGIGLANAAWYAGEGRYKEALLAGAYPIAGMSPCGGLVRQTIVRGAQSVVIVNEGSMAAADIQNGDYGKAFGHGMIIGAVAAHGTTSCFVAGTPVRTLDGSTCVEKLRVGDLVLSAPENDPTGAIEPRPVEAIFVRVSPVVRLRVRGVSIGTTAEHPFWVRGRGWIPAGMLEHGQELRGADGRWHKVEGAERTAEVTTVYNVRVNEYHTYFVGSDEYGFDLWAHNAEYETPYQDPERPGYNNGATHIDHIQARSLGGLDIEANLQGLAAETNLRKGGLEGELGTYLNSLIANGLEEDIARSIIQDEIDSLGKSPPPRPMDPSILDTLPENPLDQK